MRQDKYIIYFENHLRKRIEKAVQEFSLFNKKDKVLVAVSGGKDSLALLKLLATSHIGNINTPQIFPAYINLGFDSQDEVVKLSEFFKKIGYTEFHIENTDIGIKATTQNKTDVCFICAWNRRKRLFEIAHKNGCNKIAFAHHKDDFVETILLNMFYNGEISSMMPNQIMFNGIIFIIRPLIYIEEKLLDKYSKLINLPVIESNCPMKDKTKRVWIKKLLQNLELENKNIKKNIFKSIWNIKNEYLPKKFLKIDDIISKGKNL